MKKKYKFINIVYNNISLSCFELDKGYSLEEIENNFKDEFVKNYHYSINFNDVNVLTIHILKSYILHIKFFNIPLCKRLNDDCKRILLYLETLEFLADSNYTDRILKVKNKSIDVSFASIIAQRNLQIAQTLFREIQDSNQLVCNFLTRDIIENIKLYLYLMRGAIKEEILEGPYGKAVKENKLLDIDKIIDLNLLSENNSWDLNILKILKNNPSLEPWMQVLKELNSLNTNCNKVIHKNGITKITPNQIKYSNNIITKEDIFKCIKFFVTLVICYDGKEISSSDYIDCLEMEITPPENSQYWVAPIIKKFISLEYTKTEIKHLQKLSYMDI